MMLRRKMRKARFKETEIVRVLKEVEGGRQVKEVRREYGISDATYYNWKTKYGGMEIADIRKLKELTDENRRLKQMYPEGINTPISASNMKRQRISSKKGSEACSKARACRLCTAGAWNQSTSGV